MSNNWKIGKQRTGWWLFVALLGLFVATLTMVIFVLLKKPEEPKTEEVVETSSIQTDAPTEPEPSVVIPPEKQLSRIDFQPLVDDWISRIGGNKSVLIYDLDRGEIVGESEGDAAFATASLYKLFVVYEGYRRLSTGEWNADLPAGNTGHTILECLDLSIRESDSACAETLWSMIGRQELDEIIVRDFNITDSEISRLTSTPRDILKIMMLYYEHKDIDSKYIDRIKDSFLNQPIMPNGYNWRQGLPSGFSTATVYNKVGWDFNPDGNYWNIYHDTAIVEFPELERHFVIVVMTNRVPFQRIRELGNEIERLILDTNVNSGMSTD